MLLVALTGGIGAGKSTVARMLQEFGAIVIDADQLAREAVTVGSPALVKLVDRFGPSVLGSDGSLDRRAMARLTFQDPAARRDLEAIVHPEVARLLVERIEPFRHTDRVLVYDVPLLAEAGIGDAFDRIVTVSAPRSLREARLVSRGMDLDDARRRMAAQASDRDREAIADLVITNDGTLQALRTRTADAWHELTAGLA